MSTEPIKKQPALYTMRGLYYSTFAAIALTSFPAHADISLEELKARLEKLESRTIALENENQQLRKKVRLSRHTTYTAVASDHHSDYPQDKFKNQSTGYLLIDQPNTKGLGIVADRPSWEGAYAGINAGYGLGNIKTYTNTFTVDKTNGSVQEISNSNLASYIGGAVAGGQFGYNYLFANHILVGAEADINWADIYNNTNPNDSQAFSINAATTGQFPCSLCVPPVPGNLKKEIGTTFESNYNRVGVDWVGTARMRFGYEMGNFLPFVTAGFAYGQLTGNFHTKEYGLEAIIRAPNPPTPGATGSIELTPTGSYNLGNSSVISTGWAAGAGMEYMVAKNWSVKAEYLYISLGGITTPHISQSIEASDTKTYTLENTGGFGIHQARVGLNYHPGWTIEQPLIKAAY